MRGFSLLEALVTVVVGVCILLTAGALLSRI